jgi:hypothetical protein
VTARTITLKDGREVRFDTWQSGAMGRWIAALTFGPEIYATAPTEDAAIAALKRKLEEQQ